MWRHSCPQFSEADGHTFGDQAVASIVVGESKTIAEVHDRHAL